MDYFNGTIAEAVSLSKKKNAIFVVFVDGQNDATNKLGNFINEEKIRSKLESDDFVVIKVTSDSQAYLQFAEIYQVVPVPSIFFIGKTGTPLEIATDIMSTADELEGKIVKVLGLAGKSKISTTAGSTTLIESEKTAHESSEKISTSASEISAASVVAPVADADVPTSSTKSKNSASNVDEFEIICDGDVCYKKPKDQSETKELKTEPTNPADEPHVSHKETENKVENDVEKAPIVTAENATVDLPETSADDEEHLNDARKALEQKRRERIDEENRLEKERELQRRRDGKQMQNLRDWQKEQELKELKQNLLRDRMAEQEARERIRAQIAGDRAERAQRTATETAKASAQDAKAAEAEGKLKTQNDFNSADSTRLQFRLPSGEHRMNIFNSEQILSDVRAFVKNELLIGTNIRDFYLATTYPRQEFTVNDDTKTLIELGLVPNAVVLVIGKESKINPAGIITRSGGIINLFSSFMALLFSPFVSAYGFLRSFAIKRSSDDSTSAANAVAKRRNIDNLNLGPSTSRAATTGDADNNASKVGNALGRSPSGGTNISGSSNTNTNTNTNDNGNTPNLGSDNKPYRRFGGSNIHRLTDARKDSDDENATWNGNSTQQQ